MQRLTRSSAESDILGSMPISAHPVSWMASLADKGWRCWYLTWKTLFQISLGVIIIEIMH